MYREVSVIEVRELLRAWLSGVGLRTVAARAGVDRKTARRYVDAAVAEGLDRDGGAEQLCDELIGAVVAAMRPDRPQGYGSAWERCTPTTIGSNDWVGDGLTVVKIGDLLARQGVLVPQRTLHRYCAERTDYRGAGERRCRSPTASPGGVPDRFRPDGHAHRLPSGAPPGGACVDLHRGVFAAHVRVVDVLQTLEALDRRL